MKNLWQDSQVQSSERDLLGLRVYSSRLIGAEPDLVLHGGGNTSVKVPEKDPYGDPADVLYIKGSGWDLASIEKSGFAPVRLDELLKMAQLDELDDDRMVKLQRLAMLDPSAPNPSVEAILHAIIPYRFVDHTHADAVVTVTNTPHAQKYLQDIYGSRILIIPYVMPGFALAKYVYSVTQNLDWSEYDGMILLNHGIFTWDDDAKDSYEKMIQLVSKAEQFLKIQARIKPSFPEAADLNLLDLAKIRREVSLLRGKAVLAVLDSCPQQLRFSCREDLRAVSQRGPLTPDHLIRTKPWPVILERDVSGSLESFAQRYREYYDRHHLKHLIALDPAPRWAVWPGHGTIAFAPTIDDVRVIADIKEHTTRAIEQAEVLGGWQTLSEKDIFDMEYWVLEQAKLIKKDRPAAFQGKVILITGAASGIGHACVDEFVAQGAVVAALDIDPKIKTMFGSSRVLGIPVDVTDFSALKDAVDFTVRAFGGLDGVILNAGIFPPSESIEEMKDETWEKSLRINLDSQQKLLTFAIPFLKLGNDPSVVIVASKNVPAPGPGAAAYSVAKAGLTQLGRVAALELAPSGVRVNMVHPNAVFDTAIWSNEVLQKRAKSYGLSVEEYKRNNLLGTEVRSADVARLVVTMASPVFGKTTGAQVPIDGGNERVI